MNTAQFNSDRYSTPLDSEMNIYTKIRIQKILDFVDSCDQLLDLGCWDGFIMEQIIKTGKVKKVVGVDNSKSAVKMAVKKGLDVKLIDSVEHRLPWKNNSFDCILAGEIIEHVYDVNSFIEEIARVLKPGGSLIITTPNLASFGARITLLTGKIPWMMENELLSQSAGHIRYFTFDTLAKIVGKYGFSLDFQTCDVLHLGNVILLKNKLFTDNFYTLGRGIIAKYKKNK